MSPEPLAEMFIAPDVPVATLAPIYILELLPVVFSATVPLPDMVSALLIVRALPELTVILPDVSFMVPNVTVPRAVIVSDLLPRVMVCPADVKLPPLLNCKL